MIIIIPHNQLNIQLVILVQISTKSQNRTLVIFQLQSWFRKLFHGLGVLLQFGTSLFKEKMVSKYFQIFDKIFADQFRTIFPKWTFLRKKPCMLRDAARSTAAFDRGSTIWRHRQRHRTATLLAHLLKIQLFVWNFMVYLSNEHW